MAKAVCPSFGIRELIRLVLNTGEAYKCGRLAFIVCIFEKASNRSIFILYKTSFGYEIFFYFSKMAQGRHLVERIK